MSRSESPLVVTIEKEWLDGPPNVPDFSPGKDSCVITHADGRLELRFFGDFKKLILDTVAAEGVSVPEVVEALMRAGYCALRGPSA